MKHGLDFQKYVQFIVERVPHFLNRPEVADECEKPSFDWASREMLDLIRKHPLGITPVMITNEITLKWKSIQHFFSPPQLNEQFNCYIRSVNIYSTTNVPSLNVSQQNSNATFDIALHPAFIPLIHSNLFFGRRLSGVANHIINGFMSWPRSLIIELERRQSDFNWVKKMTSEHTLSRISDDKVPTALLVKIVDKSQTSVYIIDDSVDHPIIFELNSALGYVNLLEIGDVIAIWKPNIVKNRDNTRYLLQIGQRTAILRLPSSVSSSYPIRIDSIHGTVTNIKHIVDHAEWKECIIEIETRERKRVIIRSVHGDAIAPRRIISTFRVNHYVWLFNLIYNIDNSIQVTDLSSLYNLSLMQGFYSSQILRPLPFRVSRRLSSSVIIATITDVTIKEMKVHSDCGSIINSAFFCSTCGTEVRERSHSSLFFILTLENGVNGTITASCIHPLFGFDQLEWSMKRESQRDRERRRIIGVEMIFAISRSVQTEHGDNDLSWRIDWATSMNQENIPSTRSLITILNSDDHYIPGDVGKSRFQD